MKIAVVGAGASGLMVAGKLGELGHQVFLYEQNEKPGKKLYITGKGRCNLTNLCDNKIFFENIVNNPKFLMSCYNNFDSESTLQFFNELGLQTNVERGNRVFPLSNKSNDVINCLQKYCLKNNVKFLFNTKVESISKNSKFVILTHENKYEYDKVIISTGGKTYQATGSIGDGYKFAKEFGHEIITVRPALVPIKIKENYITSWEGISLKNVQLTAYKSNKCIKSFFGEMIFTNDGISGPISLSLSSYINRCDIDTIEIDFKPALTQDMLYKRFEREIESFKEKQLSTLMEQLLPKNMIIEFLHVCALEQTKKCKTLIKKDIDILVNKLKKFDMKFGGLYDLNFGIITSGGISTKQIDPKSMQSKLVEGLYFTGEVIDVDALTGGFNLQIAWSTANAVAMNMEE